MVPSMPQAACQVKGRVMRRLAALILTCTLSLANAALADIAGQATVIDGDTLEI